MFGRENSPVTYFQWTNTFEIGHAEIDEQHKRLLLLCTAVMEPLINSAELKPGGVQLQALIDFAQEHFAFEEGLMRSAGYPEAARHAEHHASLLEEFRRYCYNMQRSQNANPISLMSFLWSWINVHVDSEDRELVVWLRFHGPDSGG
jgi:hemerythrin